MTPRKVIFISVPYTDEDPEVVDFRVRTAQAYFMHLLEQGHTPISPVVAGHFMVHLKKPTLENWIGYCNACIAASDELHLLDVPGYTESVGCGFEVKEIEKHNRNHYLIDHQTFEVITVSGTDGA